MRESIAGAAVGAVITGIISLLIFFLGNFSTQETLERSIVESLSSRFDSIDTNMSYEQALEIIYEEREDNKSIIDSLNAQLDEKESQIKNRDSQLDEKDNLIEQLTSVEEITKIIQTANEYWNNSNYVQALALLNNSKSKASDIETLYEQYSNEYCDTLSLQADSFISEMKYDEAINLINEALKILPNNSKLKQKIDDIQNSKPRNFMDIILPYEINYYKEITGSETMSMGGEKYYNGFTLEYTYSTKPAYTIFNLNSKYTQITGMVGHIDGSGENQQTITIFADGILKQTIEIDCQALPNEFLIDVTGVKQLKIERNGRNATTGFGNLVIK